MIFGGEARRSEENREAFRFCAHLRLILHENDRYEGIGTIFRFVERTKDEEVIFGRP